MQTKPKPYSNRELESTRCQATNCKRMSYHQFFICALDGWVAVCREHDVKINFAALSTLIGPYKAHKIIQSYERKEADEFKKAKLRNKQGPAC